SVRPKGQAEYRTRAESKNVNSFRFSEKAINHEIQRQIELIEDGGKVVQETRLYDPNKNETRSMRGKEEANDYRYFPDPDLLPVVVDEALVARIASALPELPDAKLARFMSDYGLSDYDANVLTAERALADYFEAVVGAGGAGGAGGANSAAADDASKARAKTAANWVMGELTAALNRHGTQIEDSRVPAPVLAELL